MRSLLHGNTAAFLRNTDLSDHIRTNELSYEMVRIIHVNSKPYVVKCGMCVSVQIFSLEQIASLDNKLECREPKPLFDI